MKFILILSLLLTTVSSFAASCHSTYLSEQKIIELIDEEFGQGAVQFCRFSKVSGITSDYLFGRVDCDINGFSYVKHIYGEESGGFFSKVKCEIYLD